MTDTARTKAAFMALLANNSTGSISEQDLRDAVESLIPAMGHLQFQSNGYTGSTATTSTYAQVTAPAATLHASSVDMTEPSNLTLQYTDAPNRLFHVTATVTCASSIGNTTVDLYIGTGTPVAYTDIDARREIGGLNADIFTLTISKLVLMSQNDILKLYAATTSPATLTFSTINITAVGWVVA